jgi:hypothetical protein
MPNETSRDYHLRRARDELDLAYRAQGWAAIEAHFHLSALHMTRLREDSEKSPEPKA